VFNFFSRKKKQTANAGPPLTVDLHSHLLPGIDDGVRTEEESLELIRGLMELGYQKFITTPHIYRGQYNNSRETIFPALEKLKIALQSNRINITVDAAAEYFFDEFFFQQLERKEVITFGEHYVLFELAFGVRPIMLEQIVFRMNVLGYKPVLAHPERYTFFQDSKLIELEKLKGAGVFFQVNIMSLNNQYGGRAKAVARELITQNMIDFAGSDIHREIQLKSLTDAMKDKYFEKLLSSGMLQNKNL
jgi:tyrosine-protein phosphatase YwqE